MTRRAKAIKAYTEFVSCGKARMYRRYRLELVPGKREGIYLYDLNGKQYMNFHCNGGVFNFGHRNPQFLDSIRRALDTYDVGTSLAHSPLRDRLARALAAFMPGNLQHSLLCASGSEAIDAAIAIAMAHTGRGKVISAQGAYHGGSAFAIAAGDATFRAPFAPAFPGFVQVPFGDFAALEAVADGQTAAVILETIPATLGMRLAPPDYFAHIRSLCNRCGAVMIIDEVQTGLGRTGKPWGIDHWHAIPDIMVIGKGLSGGVYPIAAACMRPHLTHVFSRKPFFHFSEYGGSDVGCAVALEVLRFALSESQLEHVNRMAEWFRRELHTLQMSFPDAIVEVRQKGLFIGIVFIDEVTCALLLKILFDNGIYAVYAANDKRVLQFLPVLTISEAEAEEAMARIRKSFEHRSRLRYRALKRVLKFLAPKAV